MVVQTERAFLHDEEMAGIVKKSNRLIDVLDNLMIGEDLKDACYDNDGKKVIDIPFGKEMPDSYTDFHRRSNPNFDSIPQKPEIEPTEPPKLFYKFGNQIKQEPQNSDYPANHAVMNQILQVNLIPNCQTFDQVSS